VDFRLLICGRYTQLIADKIRIRHIRMKLEPPPDPRNDRGKSRAVVFARQRLRCAIVKLSGITISPPPGSRANSDSMVSISVGSLTLAAVICIASARPALSRAAI
jgi:hypothetical protein